MVNCGRYAAAVSRSKADAASDLWQELMRLFMSRKDLVFDLAHEHGLTMGHLKALLSLDPKEPRPMRHLAQAWRCDASNVTVMVDRLEERGYVRRETSATDRRVKTVVPTPQGEAARQQILDALTAPPPQILKLSVAELEQLTEMLKKLDLGAGSPTEFWTRPQRSDEVS